MTTATASQFVTLTPGTPYHGPELKAVEAKAMMNLAPLTAGVDQTLTTIALAYKYVPWFRTACKLRAEAIMGFPLELQNEAGDDVSEEPEYQSVMLWTRKLLYRTEMNKVKYGAAYHLLETNRFGLNMTPRFIPSPVVQPMVDYDHFGLTGFNVAYYGYSGQYPLNRMFWVWEENDESEIWPGPSDGDAGLKAAGLLYAIQEVANRYMGSGGVPVTAVMVAPTADKEERTKIEGWLAKFAGGFRNAFKFLAVDRGTEFATIGSEMKDLQAVELTASERDNVAVAMRVPPTVIDASSANYATADSEMTGFYLNVVIPESEKLEPDLNTQLYQRIGLRLRFKPDELKILKSIKQKQAQGVALLVGGKPIASINEARGMVDLDPVETPDGELDPQFDVVAPPAPEPPKVVVAPVAGSTASPGLPTPAASPASAGSPDVNGMRALQRQSLAQFKAGQSAAVGVWFDDELEAASSGNMVRSAYLAHWPRPTASLDERRIAALEQYNALVLAGSVPSV